MALRAGLWGRQEGTSHGFLPHSGQPLVLDMCSDRPTFPRNSFLDDPVSLRPMQAPGNRAVSITAQRVGLNPSQRDALAPPLRDATGGSPSHRAAVLHVGVSPWPARRRPPLGACFSCATAGTGASRTGKRMRPPPLSSPTLPLSLSWPEILHRH